MPCSPRFVGLALAALLAAPAQAQVAAQPQPPAPSRPAVADPLDARAAVPPALHASTLARYKPAGDGAVGSWREANDTVARIGGWKAYAREAQAAAPGGASAAPGASAAAPGPSAAAPGSSAASTPAPTAPASPASAAARPAAVPGQSGHPGHLGRQ